MIGPPRTSRYRPTVLNSTRGGVHPHGILLRSTRRAHLNHYDAVGPREQFLRPAPQGAAGSIHFRGSGSAPRSEQPPLPTPVKRNRGTSLSPPRGGGVQRRRPEVRPTRSLGAKKKVKKMGDKPSRKFTSPRWSLTTPQGSPHAYCDAFFYSKKVFLPILFSFFRFMMSSHAPPIQVPIRGKIRAAENGGELTARPDRLEVKRPPKPPLAKAEDTPRRPPGR